MSTMQSQMFTLCRQGGIMNQSSKRYYLVRADILPRQLETAEAKEILAKRS